MKKLVLVIILQLIILNSIAQTKLHPNLPANSSIEYYEISPDGNHIVYIADLDEDDVFELYSNSIDGGANIKLNGTLVSGGDVSFGSLFRFQISSDSKTVVYLADQETDGLPELYSVPITGGNVTKLNGSLAGTSGVRTFKISPDDQTVVYVADELDRFDIELFSVPITGGTSKKLSQPDLGIGDVNITFNISPDSQWVVYVADAESPSVQELYSVSINGGNINKLNGTLPNSADVESAKVFITNDNKRVVYLADQDTRFVKELYSIPIEGGTITKLNTTITTSTDDVERVYVSPDGQWVVYVEGNFANQDFEIYGVPVTGGTVNKLNNDEIDNDFDGSLRSSVKFSPDSNQVFYTVNTKNYSSITPELFSVPVDGSEDPTNLSVTQQAKSKRAFNSRAGVFDFIPKAIKTLYVLADLHSDKTQTELWKILLGGSNSKTNSINRVKLNGNLVDEGNVTDVKLSADGTKILYRADQETDNLFEIYITEEDGSTQPKKLNGNLIANGDVIFDHNTLNSSSFDGVQFSPTNTRVVYLADQDTDGIYELYSVDYSTILSSETNNYNSPRIFTDNQENLNIKGIQSSKTTIQLYSFLGRKVFETNISGSNEYSIQIPANVTGFNIVNIFTNDGKTYSRKILFE